MPLLSTIGAAAARAFGFLRSLISGYNVANSLRFNSGSSDYLSRTPAVAGNRQIMTFSFWTKISNVTSRMATYNFGNSTGTPGSGDGNIFFNQGSDQSLVVSAGGGVDMNVVTTQATASNRVKVYINGTQVTSFSATTYPSQNYNLNVTNTSIQRLGTGYDGGITYYYNGYLSEFYLIDGQQLTPSSFGETDTLTGIWKPKAYTGSYGTNGFYLQFKNSASLGTDSSGNGNTFTVNNLTSVDQSTDTPTNNFCTMNPLDFGDNATSYATFSEGNLKAIGNTSAWRGSHGTMGVSKGKWYFEGKAIGVPDGDTGVYIGWCDPALATTYDVGGNNANYNFYIWTNGAIRFNNSITSSYYLFTQDDICGFALDLDNGKGYISKNGTFYNNGNTSSTPNTGSPDFTITLPPTNNGVLVPCILAYNDGGFFLNFGSPPYSANSYTDGAGYGNFSYAVPSGYFALCTKNLAQYG
jgi:hypothetical protein